MLRCPHHSKKENCGCNANPMFGAFGSVDVSDEKKCAICFKHCGSIRRVVSLIQLELSRDTSEY